VADTFRIPIGLRKVREHFVEGNRVKLLHGGGEAFSAMLQAIDEARVQVLLEMYWFASDQIGTRFAEALKAASARGVEVLVIYDSLGSRNTSVKMFDDLRQQGVRVVEFNPILPWQSRFATKRLSQRDHRKVLVVDGRTGFTGGMNIADEWLPPPERTTPAWRDDMVQVDGPAVGNFVRGFAEVWQRQDGPAWRTNPAIEEGVPSAGGHRVRVLREGFRNRREITRAYRLRIYAAKKRVWITNSYFVPDGRVIRALKRAARRGVDVRVLLPSVLDIPMIRYASRAVWTDLLAAKVRIFELQDVVLHAKTAVIDGFWSTLGTFNLDHLSLRNNLEVNVAVEDHSFGSMMEESFERDLGHSREVTAAEFQDRPLSDRVIESMLYRFRKFL
jgi:cardiolipin synthase